jgi:gluconokinase
VYAISKPIIEKRDIRLIYVTGGFAQNDLWVQILSDVFNLPVCISDTVENAAWGAVKTGMEALKLPSAGEENKSKIFNPSPELHLVYQCQFKKFERLYDLIKEEF